MNVSKDANGWRASTKVDLGSSRELEICTRKGSSGFLVTYARVDTIDGNWKSHVMFQDFNINVTSSKERVTEKAVRTQHERALLDFDKIVEQAKAHYRKELA